MYEIILLSEWLEQYMTYILVDEFSCVMEVQRSSIGAMYQTYCDYIWVRFGKIIIEPGRSKRRQLSRWIEDVHLSEVSSVSV